MRASKQIEYSEAILKNIDNIDKTNIKNDKRYKKYFECVYKCIYNYYIDYMSSEKEAYKLFKTDEEKKRIKANYENKSTITKDLLSELNIFNKSNDKNNNIKSLFELFKIYSERCCIYDNEEIIDFMKLFI